MNYRDIKFYFLFIFYIVYYNSLFSQNKNENYILHKFSDENGLPSNLISDANVDENGYLWFATQAGISRFDGENFVNYSTANFSNIKSNRFIIIDKKQDGKLYVLNESFQLFFIDKQSKLVEIANYKYGKDFIFSINKKIVFQKDFKFNKEELNAYLKNTNQFYWINKTSYYRFVKKNIFYNGKIKLPQLDFKEYVNKSFDINGVFYIVDNRKNIYSIIKDKIELVCNLEKKLNTKFNIDQLWISSNNGLFTLNTGNEVFEISKSSSGLIFTKLNYLFNTIDKVTLIKNPKENYNFFYTQKSGFFDFRNTIFKTIALRDSKSIKDNEIYRVLTNKQSEIQGKFFNNILSKASLANDYDLWFNKNDDTICFLNNEFIVSVNGEKFHVNKLGNKVLTFANGAFIDILKFENKLYVIKGDKIFDFKSYNELEILFTSKINDISTACKINKQNKWLLGSKNQGVHVYDLDLKTVVNIPFFQNKEVRQIKFDSILNRYWVFTYGAGIYLMDNHFKITPFYKDNYGNLNFAHYYLKDSIGYYWIPTNNGLFQFHSKEVRSFLKNKEHEIYFNYYNTSNGLVSNEFNGRYSNSGIVLPNGYLAFSNMAGIVTVNPYILPRTKNNNPILIDEVLLNNIKLKINNSYVLTEGFSDFQISVSSPNFYIRNKAHLEYQIPEISNKWNILHNQKLNLLSLKSGTYQILFRKIGDSNKLDYKLITLKVNPKWYASNIAYIFYFALLLLVGFLLSRAFTNRKQIKLNNEIRLLESELKAMRSQINPHYLSNSLMSLQSVVLDNDNEKAFEFIGQYGKVMRSILEKSDYSFISLDQEIQTLKEYIKLEGLIRNISIDFDYHFHSNNTDATITNVKVPTMIFQPFVENAILHGLVPKKQKLNRIQLDVKLEDKQLHVIITDNGLGYNKKLSDRKSYGLDNIQNRLKAYSKLLKNEAFFTIENIGEESDSKSGTRVTLNIPYLIESENNN